VEFCGVVLVSALLLVVGAEGVPAADLRALRDEIAAVRTNQTLLKGGRIWP
jgi:hypothetical protein